MIQSFFHKTGLWSLPLSLFLCLPHLLFSQQNQNPASGAVTAVLSLAGPDTICGGTRDTLSIDFTGDPGPYIVYYSINGVPQPPDTTNADPYIFLTPILSVDTTVVRLDSVFSNGMLGMVSGMDTITVLPFPTATLSSDTVTVCLGDSITLQIAFEGPGPYTFQYAANLDTMPPITTADTLFNISIFPTPGQTVYTLAQVQGGGCGGMVQGIYSVRVANAATATLTGDTTICPGSSTPLSIAFTGDPPYAVGYTANGVPQPNDTAFFNPRILIVSPDTTTTYQLTSASSNGCSGTVAGQAFVEVLPNLTATISGGDQICQSGAGTTISIAFEGPGPYTFIYKAGNNIQPAITTSNNPHIINVNPPNGTIYQLVSVTNGTCTGTVSGIAVVAVFTPSTAELISDITVCNAADTTVMVDFTGSGPFTLVYKVDGVIQDTVMTFDDPYLIPANVTTTTNYELVSIESPGCFGSITGPASINVFVNYPPTFNNVVLNCDLVAGTYTVEFDAVDATTPLTLITGSGNFVGTHFTSNPIPLALDYNFVFHDANDCGDITVSGAGTCNCMTDAGGMDPTPLAACTATPVTASPLGNEALEPGDVLVFVLHTSAGSGLGTILDTQNQPIFSFQPGTMMVGTTYYISAVAGDDNGMGSVDLNDPCLSVSLGQPVVWNLSPTATIDATFDICPGGQVLVPVTFTGVPPFTFTYTNNGQSNTVLALQNMFSISATLLTTTTFQAVAVENALCPGTATGQAIANVHPAPQITGIQVVCADDNLTYTVDFDVTNADSSTVAIGGSVTGNFDPISGHFTSNPIQAQTGFSAVVTDSWQCGLDSISGGANCSCTTSAGMMDQVPQILCSGDTASTSPTTGSFLAPGDTLVYALVTSPSPMMWNILAYSQDPKFVFDPGNMVPGTTYYIVALAGNIIPGGGIDLNDVCFSIGLGPSVTWQPQGTMFLASDTEICQGDSATLTILFSGNPPYNFIYQIDAVDQPPLVSAGPQYLLSVSPSQTSTYALSSGTANGCPANVDGTAQVTVNATPQILSLVENCDLTTFTYTVAFAVSNGSAPNPTYSVSGLQGSFTDSIFTSVAIPSGQPYDLVVSTPQGCTAQISGLVNCACTTNAGTLTSVGPLNFCLPDTAMVQSGNDAVLNPGDGLQYILYQNPASLPMGIIGRSQTPQFAMQAGMMPGVTYYISAIAGVALPNGDVDLAHPCLSVSPGVPIVFRVPPTASLSGDTTICVGTNTLFKINFTGSNPFKFVYAINGNQQSAVSAPQNSFTVSTNNIQQNQLFTLISVEDAYCVGTVSGSYTVTVQPPPTAALASNTSICAGDSAELRLQLGGATLYDLTINGGATPIQLNGISSGTTFSVAPGSTTTYTIGNFVAQGNNCAATIGPGVTVTVGSPLTATATLSDYNGFNLSCPDAQDGSIMLQPLGGTAPVMASWSSGMSGLSLQNLEAGTYSVILTDGLGCSFVDTFILLAPAGLMLDFEVKGPVCFGARNGLISLENVLGGSGPFVVRLNGAQVQITDVFPVVMSNLAAGQYELEISDINGCANIVDTFLFEPPLLTVNLGPDTLIFPGDSILLLPIVTGSGLDSFVWSPQTGLNTPLALTTFAKPFQPMFYKLMVWDSVGCRAEDEIKISVRKESRVYVANVFNPDLGGENGMLTVYTGPEILRIKTFRVYDRWGENIFEGLNLSPNEPAQGWNGQWQGKIVQPGVYVWVVELEYQDGTTEIKAGDVTVIR